MLTITDNDVDALSELMDLYGYGGECISVRPLLNSDNQEQYLLAVSENGHLIVERDDYRFCQCGEGNPYAGHEDQTCYYGGPLCYYAAIENKQENTQLFYDLLRAEYTEEITTLARDNGNSRLSDLRGDDDNIEAVLLPNSFDYIRRIAFGFNDDNTCSAVATGIALTYIALAENMKIVKNYHVAEMITERACNSEDAKTKYPNACALHRYIAEDANMGSANFGYEVDDAIDDYYNLLKDWYPLSKYYQLDASWTMSPKADTIYQNIVNGKPVLITTSVFGGMFAKHTMCVYGYQRINGNDSLLVHTGWWNKTGSTEFHNEYNNGSSYLVKSQLWIDESWATFGHYFTYVNPLKNYEDIPSFTEYTYTGILYCVKNGIMTGTDDGQFSPDGILTRGEIAQIMYTAAGSPVQNGIEPFDDVKPKDYFYDAVRWAYNNKLVVGTDETHYSPKMTLTRGQLAVMLLGFAKYLKKNTVIPDNHSFILDYKEDYSADAIRWAAWHKVLYSDNGPWSLTPVKGKYRQKKPVTRAETSYALYALLEMGS